MLRVGGGRRCVVPANYRKPTFGLNLMTGVLPSGLSLSRASTASYVNSSGLVAVATSGTARFNFNPTSLILEGMLRENAGTNLTLHSDMASGWTFTNASFTQAAATGPDGVASSAVKLVEAASTSSHFGGIGAIAITTGSTNTFSVWLKAAERSTAQMQLTDGALATGIRAFVDLSAGSVTSTSTLGTGAVSTATAERYPNGWTRFRLTGTVDASTTSTARITIQINNVSYAGDGTSGIFCWGAQAEAGTIATSYFATGATTATRVADTFTILTSAFPYNASAGTLVAKYIPKSVGTANQAILELDDGSAVNRIAARMATATGAGSFLMVAASVVSAQFSTGNAAVANTINRQAIAWQLADDALTLNGGVVQVSAAGTPLPTGLTTLRIGDSASAGQGINACFQSIGYFNYRISNARLPSLTVS